MFQIKNSEINIRQEVKAYIETGKFNYLVSEKALKKSFKMLSADELDQINNEVLDSKPKSFKNKMAYITDSTESIRNYSHFITLSLGLPLGFFWLSRVTTVLRSSVSYKTYYHYSDIIDVLRIGILSTAVLLALCARSFAFEKIRSKLSERAYRVKINKLNEIDIRITKILDLILDCRPVNYTKPRYKVTSNLVGDNLLHYPVNRRFITEDNYCFTIDELIAIHENQSRLYNPYTNQDFSETDYQALLKFEKINDCVHSHILRQKNLGQLISNNTIKQLTRLAEGLLNKEEINNQFYNSVPLAESAYDKFDSYYKKLDQNELSALNEFWIKGFEAIWTNEFSMLNGMKPIQFMQFYASLNNYCSHTLGAAIIMLVLQLDPSVEFDFESEIGYFIVKKFLKTLESGADEYTGMLKL